MLRPVHFYFHTKNLLTLSINKKAHSDGKKNATTFAPQNCSDLHTKLWILTAEFTLILK